MVGREKDVTNGTFVCGLDHRRDQNGCSFGNLHFEIPSRTEKVHCRNVKIENVEKELSNDIESTNLHSNSQEKS